MLHQAYSAQDLERAAVFRAGIHEEALARVRAVYPQAESVVDRYAAEDYFQELWDYPGQWYAMVGTPEGAGSRKALVESIVRNTLEQYRLAGVAPCEEAFYRALAACPDVVCDFCLVTAEELREENESAFLYSGSSSHRCALACAVHKLFADDNEWYFEPERAKCKKLSSKALFAPVNADAWLNYRKAFLCPPHENAYTDRDFERFNAVLFPGGAEALEVFRWTTDWSNYFDSGHEWWGALCLSVYDKTLERFVIILASETD